MIYAIGPQLPKLAGIFALPFTTQYLTPYDYGVAGLVSAYLGALSGLRDLGFVVILTNTYFGHPTRWKPIWRLLHGWMMVWSPAFALLASAVLWAFLPEQVANELALIIFLCVSPVVLFEPTVMFATRYLQFVQRPMYISLVSAVTGVLGVGLNVLFICGLRMGFFGWFLAAFLTSFLSFLAYTKPIYFEAGITPIFRWRPRSLRRYLAVSLPLVPHNYSSYLYSGADRFIMDRLRVSVDAIGKYNVAYNVGNYFSTAATSVGLAVGPVMTKLYARRTLSATRDNRALVFFLQFAFLVGGGLTALWAKELVYLLIRNDALREAYPVTCVVIMSHVSRPMYWEVMNKLAFHKRTSQIWKISFVTGLVNVALNLVFIPLYGPLAAAFTTFFSLLLANFGGFWLPQYRQLSELPFYPLLFAGAVLSTTLAAYLAQDMSIWWKLLSTALVLCLGLWAFWRARHHLQAIDF